MRTRILRTRIFSCILAASMALAAQTGPAEYVQAARKLNNEGKQDQAIEQYRRALEAAPDSVEAHLGAGVALDLKGDYTEARKHLAKAIDLAKPEAKQQALRTMAMSYAFEHNAKQAIKYEKEVFDSQLARQDFPAAAETANELARICIESGDF